MDKCIYFFIGTEAELIKIFPIMILLQEMDIKYKTIASGQNDILKSNVLKQVNGGKIDIILSNSYNIKKTTLGLFFWFLKTYFAAKEILKNERELKGSILLVHGDTISTVMGARLGHKSGMKVAHVEAGLRSFDIFNPFPEEIDRLIVSKFAHLHFAPNQLAYDNLKRIKGKKYNTQGNTILDSLRFSNNVQVVSKLLENMDKRYFVFIMHRQENLANKDFVISVIDKIIKISQSIKCIMILHEPTELKLKEYKLFDTVKNDNNIITMPRVEYFDFMKYLKNSEFVITDGGSNQEELAYIGKPCLIMRKRTERSDGIGKNIIMYEGNINIIDDFAKNYKKYEIDCVMNSISPSEIIVNALMENIKVFQHE